MQKAQYLIPVLITTTLAVFLFLNTAVPGFGVAAYLDSLSLNLLYAGVAVILRYPARFLLPERGAVAGFWLKQAGAAAVITILVISLQHTVLMQFVAGNPYGDYLQSSLQWRYITGFLVTSVIQMLVYFSVFWERSSRQAAEEAELRAMVSEAELRSLKYQINPHFLFNSLNSVAALTAVNPSAARDMVIKLSELLRSTLSENLRQLSPLDKELEIAALYMEIEQVRFGERLSYNVELQDGAGAALVPSMVLQPLLENAVKHGMNSITETVQVQVQARLEAGFIILAVVNTFGGNTGAKPKGEGIGKKNIAARLSLIYDGSARIHTELEDGRYRVILYIPQ